MTRLEELERAKAKLEVLVRAAVAVASDSTAHDAWQRTDGKLLDRATRALARVYAEIDAMKPGVGA